MLELLKNESTVKNTFNGAKTYSTSNSECLDLFFRAAHGHPAADDGDGGRHRAVIPDDPLHVQGGLHILRIRHAVGKNGAFQCHDRFSFIDRCLNFF